MCIKFIHINATIIINIILISGKCQICKFNNLSKGNWPYNEDQSNHNVSNILASRLLDVKQMERAAGFSCGVNCWSKGQIMQRSCFICAPWPMHLSSYIRSNLRPISRYIEQSTPTVKRYFGIMHQQGVHSPLWICGLLVESKKHKDITKIIAANYLLSREIQNLGICAFHVNSS